LVGQNVGFGSTEAQQQRRGDAYLADDILGGWGGGLWGNAACAAKEPHDVDGLYVIVAPCRNRFKLGATDR
jgi:hypothetical protein